MKKILVCLIPFLIMFNGCSKKNGIVKIGVIMPLTGSAASVGVPCYDGIQLSINQYNKQKLPSSPVIQLVTEDSKALAGNSVSAFQKLTSIGEIKVIIGPLTSGEVIACAPLANKNHIVILSPGSSASIISTIGDYVFRNELSDSIGAVYQAKLAIEKLKFFRIACVYINNDYGVGLFEDFKSTFEKLGGKILIGEGFQPGTVDFRSIIAKLKTTSVDAVFIIAIDEIVDFVNQKSEIGLKTVIYTTPIFENQEYINKLGKLSDGIIYTYYGSYNLSSKSRSMQSFLTNYKEQYHSIPTYYSALGYDASNIVCSILTNISFNEERVKDAFYNIHNFPGISGQMTFDKNGDVEKVVSLKKVKNGEFIYYDPSN